MKRNKNLIALSVSLIVLMSSCISYHTTKGNADYDYSNYASAIKHFGKVYPKKKGAGVELKLADAYYKTNKLDSAEAIYARAIARGNSDSYIHFDYGKILMAQGKHQQAAIEFEKYLKDYPNDATAQMLIASCNSVIDRYRDTTQYTLDPIADDQFANAFSIIEYQDGAVFSGDKKVFSGRKKNPWTGDSYLGLYLMEKDADGDWLNPELLKGDINGRFHEGPATFTKDGNTVYFTRSNYFKRKMVVNEEKVNNLKIFKSTLINGEWKKLEEFPFNSDDYSCGHPTLTEDGKTMYFVSDMPGGLGGTDLYKTTLGNDGNWSTPINLGSEVNTGGNEMFPFINTDGSLYFSSDAHNTLGGLDVFITYFNGERWMKPENLNYPLNSTKDDFGFSYNKDGVTGFVSSSRSKSDKMYSFEKHPATFVLYGRAREKGTQIPVEGVVVEITNAETGQVSSITSDKEGNFKFKLAPETNYNLFCTKHGCFSKTDKIITKGLKYSEDFYADFEVETIVIDKAIVLENIYYDFDKWAIRKDAAIELDKLVKILQDNPTIEIEMGSHTDSRGPDAYNMILSDKRANAAVNYLIARGIDASRLTWKGYGETVHVNRCKNDVVCSEVDHQKNRRTEFKVKKVNQ